MSVVQDDDVSKQPLNSSATNGLSVEVEGFQAQAAAADDGRVNIDLQKPSKVRAAVERLLRSMGEHDDHFAEIDHDTSKVPPPLNIVIQIVGSRGDVQPFLALGLELQKFGHRVRIATHSPFRTFVESSGLEFFDVGGDPKEMMAYMVKNPGLLPHLESVHKGDVTKSRKGIREILNGCWLSCIAEDNGLDTATANKTKPFVANAIIANPPSFAHLHCAEKLGIPLHMMFTMPWSPTRSFSHPLANINTCSIDVSAANYFSFTLTESLMWLGLGDLINAFRTETLGLRPVNIISAATAVPRLDIPFTYCWSPSLIPKPGDWGPTINVSGNYNLQSASTYTPPHHLTEFLENGSRPIYIGFGSIVLDDPDQVTQILLRAIQEAGVRAVISGGWAGLGRNTTGLPPDALLIDNCPHDWIFERVSCTVHHGGAGTTAAAVAAGKPSIIIPFFGDQPFWGRAVAMAGAGPKPIPFARLSAENLAAAIRAALDPKVLKKASELGAQVAMENGVASGVQTFHRQLAKYTLNCSICPSRAAAWKVRKTDVKLSALATTVLTENGLLDSRSIEPFRARSYDLNFGALDPLTGTANAAIDSAVQLLQGVKEIGTSFTATSKASHSPSGGDKPDKGARARSLGVGANRVSRAVVSGPINTGVAITQGLHNSPRLWGGRVQRRQPCVTDFGSGLKAGGSELGFGIYDGITGIFLEPYSHARRDGVAGSVSGLGIGVLSCISKTTSGITGAVSYPLKGIDEHIAKFIDSRKESPVECALAAQGQREYIDASMEDRETILRIWKTRT